MRRVIVGVDDDGRSMVTSDEEIPDLGRIWAVNPQDPALWTKLLDPQAIYAPAQPPQGGALWYLSEFEPRRGMAPRKVDAAGMDSRGFHATNTIDFVYILMGTLLLDLDHGAVEVREGDCVVLHSANHAWRNPTSSPARFLDLLLSAEPFNVLS